METKLKLRKLPVGIQTFEKIRIDNSIYVDKTRFLVNMIDTGKIFFFARPRRFGKSLTASTLDAMFSDKKELFKGLYAEEFMNRSDYRPSPVIWLDMSDVTNNEGTAVFSSALKDLVMEQGKNQGVALEPKKAPGELFSALIRETYRKNGNEKVVVIIDEYDKPYSDFVDDGKMADKMRKILRNFYVRVKVNDKYIRFTFITGIAKFGKFGGYSTLNNIIDISMNGNYGAMCGFTEEEIRTYFPEHIDATAEKFGVTPDKLLEMMRDYYDGFSFDGINRLYNPFSTLCFFMEREFNDYWVESGTSEMIASYLKTRHLTVEQFRNFSVSRDFVDEPGDIDSTPPEGFLYQCGYLTISKRINDDVRLDYPNTEVLNAMSRLLTRNITDNRYNDYRVMLMESLSEYDVERFVETLNSLLSSIPYDDFADSGNLNIIINKYTYHAREWLYRSTILAFMRGCGVAALAEMHTNRGRADLVVSHNGNTFVVELKVAYKTKEVPGKLAEAVEQMTKNNYLGPYPGAKGLAMVIDDAKRRITANTVVIR